MDIPNVSPWLRRALRRYSNKEDPVATNINAAAAKVD
jgi:hypothetical protein